MTREKWNIQYENMERPARWSKRSSRTRYDWNTYTISLWQFGIDKIAEIINEIDDSSRILETLIDLSS